jgi:hypothetical protein
MPVDDGENAEHLPGTHEGGRGVRGEVLPTVNNHAMVHELNQIKTEALRDIDESGFSCAATLSPSAACSAHQAAVKLVSF